MPHLVVDGMVDGDDLRMTVTAALVAWLGGRCPHQDRHQHRHTHAGGHLVGEDGRKHELRVFAAVVDSM